MFNWILKNCNKWSTFKEDENKIKFQIENKNAVRMVSKKLEILAKICEARISDIMD